MSKRLNNFFYERRQVNTIVRLCSVALSSLLPAVGRWFVAPVNLTITENRKKPTKQLLYTSSTKIESLNAYFK